jgi:tetratricopeptide (TPR) repeat protein
VLSVVSGRQGAPAAVPDLNVEAAVWNADTTGNIRLHEAALREAAADAPKAERSEARLRLARFLLANRFFPEAGAVLNVLVRDDEIAGASKPVLMAQLMAAVLGDRSHEARALLARPKLTDDAEAQLWRAVLDAGERAWPAALVGFRKAMPILDSYPDGLNLLLRPLVIEAALASGDPVFARDQIGRYESLQGVRPNLALAALQRGRAAALLGREDEALREFDAAVKGDREVEARARLERVLYQLKQNRIERPAAIAELETIGAIWRRGDVEVRSLAELGKLYAATGRWREAFGTARRAVQIMPDHPQARSLQDEMARAFAAMFIGGKDQGLSKVEALGLYYDFKNFTPPGRDGDEMIRHLADRLADLDLLDQSTELLRHQVEHRLEGAARARVAASLAVLYLRNHKPSEAVEVLRETRLNGLPRDLARGRTMLEARGLSEMSLTDAALELAASQDGPEAEQLRADILWRGKRWRAAGEALEFKLHDRWRETTPLGDGERMDVLRGAVAYVLGDDAIGLDRLRSKYATLMADSADAHTFGLIAGQAATRPGDFREVARAVVSADTLKAFLDSYHKRFPAVVPAAAQPAAEQPMPPKPAAEQAKATPPAGGKAA